MSQTRDEWEKSTVLELGNCISWHFVDFIDLDIRSQDSYPISLINFLYKIMNIMQLVEQVVKGSMKTE